MSDAAPPAWVKLAPGLSAAHKFMLSVLWGYGPYQGNDSKWVNVGDDRQPAKAVRCWESCAELAKLTDQPLGTVRKQLRKLAADGWILRGSGSMRTLAWRAPGVFAYGAGGKDAHPLTTRDPGQECSPPMPSCSPPDHEVPTKVTTEGPQTLQEHSNQQSSNVEVARDSPSVLAALDAQEQLAVYGATETRTEHGGWVGPGNPAEDWRRNRSRLLLEAQQAREDAASTGAMPTGSKLPPEVHRAIEAHNGGAWSAQVMSQTWADACAQAMDGLGLDVDRVLALLDAWTDQARPCVQAGQPSKREIWFTWGARGKLARAWLLRQLEATRTRLRVVSSAEAYEAEKAASER